MNEYRRQIDRALKESVPPLTTRDLQISIPGVPDRTIRRRVKKHEEMGLLTQQKKSRGYRQGVTYVITSINKELLERKTYEPET